MTAPKPNQEKERRNFLIAVALLMNENNIRKKLKLEYLEKLMQTVEGFCYHCVNCEYSSMFEKSCVYHSQAEEHGLVRCYRGNCNEHNGKSIA